MAEPGDVRTTVGPPVFAAAIVAVAFALAVAPPLSVTLSVNVNAPLVVYKCDVAGELPIPLVPSPQFQS